MTANEEAEEAMDYAEELTELEEDIITEMEFIFGKFTHSRFCDIWFTLWKGGRKM